MRRFLLPLFALALIFSACATPKPAPQAQKIDEGELKLVLIKSKNIRFYDFGTLNIDENANRIKLNVFKLGKFLGSFVVTKGEICYTDFVKVDDCAPKWVAARSFFGDVSYGELFEDIFLKRDIFDGQGKRLTENGAIIQEFSYGGNKIYYERSGGRIYFKNFTNGVIVSIEDYKK
ncbi:hypothetical protein [Helicobacter sp. 23-1045]